MANGTIDPSQNFYQAPDSSTFNPPDSSNFQKETINQKPKGKAVKIIVGVLIGIIFVTSVGATVALYVRAWDPLWNPFRPEPDKVIQEMNQVMGKLKTMHSEIGVNFEAQEESMPFKIHANFKNDIDRTDSKNLKSNSKFDFIFNIFAMEYSLSGESKNLDKISFLKLDMIPGPVITFLREMLGFNWNSIGGKWIKIDPESLAQSLPNIFKKFLSPDEQAEMEGFLKGQGDIEISEEKQEELENKIKKITSGKKFFLVKKEFPDTNIGELKTYHYLMTFDRAEVKSTIPDMVSLFFDTAEDLNPELFQMMTEEEINKAEEDTIAELEKSFDEFFGKVGDINGELWIGKKDYYLYKIKIDKEIDLNKIDEYAKGKLIFNLDTNFSNFNKPASIETPKESKLLEDILLEIANGLVDIRIKNYLSEVGWEARYLNYDDDSFENLCTEPPSSTLNEKAPSYSGSVLSRIKKEITTLQGGKIDLLCLDSVTSYCVQAKLINMDKRFCIDSQGQEKIIEKNQSCIGTGTLQNPYKCP